MRISKLLSAVLIVAFCFVASDANAQKLKSKRPEHVPLMVYEEKDSVWYGKIMKE